LSFQPVEQLRFVHQEFHERNSPALRFDGDSGEPHQPTRDFVFFICRFERFVITLAARKNGRRQRCERRLTEALRQSFLSNGTSNAHVAILERKLL